MDTIDQAVEKIISTIRQFLNEGKKIFATSSFQTQSVVLLRILGSAFPEMPIYFLNTGYQFNDILGFGLPQV